jgi:hypothetical protein
MSVMSVCEFILWIVLGFLFWQKKLHRRFPAMGSYLALRVASTPPLLVLLYGQSRHWFNDYCFMVYFFCYWAVYIASAVILFLVCIEVFRSALSAFSGLAKLGTVIFRWAAFVSMLLSVSTVSFSHRGILIVSDIAFGLMRSVSVIELCLLGFLCLSLNSLRLSVRDRAFGISLGFGLMASSDFILSSFWSRTTSLTDSLQLVSEAVILAALGIWLAYCVLPEPARKPVILQVNSAAYRWNEIASALGHTGTQVAMRQPANGFFLSDVERVVEKVLNRNLKKSESES